MVKKKKLPRLFQKPLLFSSSNFKREHLTQTIFNPNVNKLFLKQSSFLPWIFINYACINQVGVCRIAQANLNQLANGEESFESFLAGIHNSWVAVADLELPVMMCISCSPNNWLSLGRNINRAESERLAIALDPC